jgi:hypothetical protein
MGNEERRERERLYNEKQQKLREEVRLSRQKLAEGIEQKKEIRTAFTTILDKIQGYIDIGGTKVEAGSKLKTEINDFLNNPDYESYTGAKSNKGFSLGNTKNPYAIRVFLETRSRKITDDIKQIEESNKDDCEHK